MKEISIKYNPYTVTTEFTMHGVPVEKMKGFFERQEGVRLQEWIEPDNAWEGFFGELYRCIDSSEVKISFRGTDVDFEDLQYASEKYGKSFEKIELEHVKSDNEVDRLAEIEHKLTELMDGPYEELKDEQIQSAFKKAISPEFEVVVVAPMSSGKSTMINSILGTNLLPAVNTATTATISKIKNVDGKEFTVYCKSKDGKLLANYEKASLEMLNNLNDQAKDIECINIEGDIPNIPSEKVDVVFVDTPGGNNSQDALHMSIMKDAINDENKGMILYVFNFTQLETGDCDQILSLVAEAMRNSAGEKRLRDRFIFVCNKMDAQNPETEPYDKIIERIRKNLEEKGISDPNLFLTCADACKLIRMKKSGIELCDSDDDRLHGYLRPFNRDSRQLFKYASISDELKAEFKNKVDELSKDGDAENLEIAEINSGIPALEAAIHTYIKKYALAIKIKTVHDVFMRKVNELEMIGKSKETWARSQEEYETMRKELAAKIAVYEKDQQLQQFKEKIDAIETDYSVAMGMKEAFIANIKDMAFSHPDNVKKSEVGNVLNEFQEQLTVAGNKLQDDLNVFLEDCLYKQCKEALGEYKAYVSELDRKGLLNVGDYNFRKVEHFNNLNVSELSEESISDEYVHTEVVDALKVKKRGFINAIKRLFANIDGWDIVSVKEDFVSINKYMQEIIGDLEKELVREFELEINRAKENERRVKEFVKAELSGIDTKVKEEFQKIEAATADKKELEKRVAENKFGMEWLTKFVADMGRILDI